MNSESILQQTTVAMIRTLYPKFVLNLSLNGIPLTGLSSQQISQVITQAKREGMEPGIMDLSIYLPSGKILNLEFKRPKGGVQSDDQKIIQSKLQALGHNYHLIRDTNTVFKLIAENTIHADRVDAFNSLDIQSDDEVLIEPFLHYPIGTPKCQVLDDLVKLYHI